MRVKRTDFKILRRTAFVLTVLACATAAAQGVKFATGNYSNNSQVVPSTATTIIPAPVGNNGTRMRIVLLDTACQTGSAVTVWCAWGTAAANPAVVGANGFPLACGYDDSGTGVNQNAVNCIQPSGTHYVRAEQY